MGFLDKFFNRSAPQQGTSHSSLETSPVTFSVLFERPYSLETERATAALRALASSLRGATFEIEAETSAQGTPLGLATWGKHAVKLVGFNAPLPAPAVEECVAPAHYDETLKARAGAHQAHALLYYGGRESDSLEQYIALELVAISLREFGAFLVLNGNARTSLPLDALGADAAPLDRLTFLSTFPLLYLPCGFVKYEIEGRAGVFMRTYGAHLFGFPDLGTFANGHQKGSEVFEIFSNIFDYLRENGPVLAAGHTMQVSEDEYMKLRDLHPDEEMLRDENPLLIADFISESQINSLSH